MQVDPMRLGPKHARPAMGRRIIIIVISISIIIVVLNIPTGDDSPRLGNGRSIWGGAHLDKTLRTPTKVEALPVIRRPIAGRAC